MAQNFNIRSWAVSVWAGLDYQWSENKKECDGNFLSSSFDCWRSPLPSSFFPLCRRCTITESMTAAAGSFHSQTKVFADTGAVLSLSPELKSHSQHTTLYLPLTIITFTIFCGRKPQADNGLKPFAFWGSNRFWLKNKVLGNQWVCFKSSQCG